MSFPASVAIFANNSEIEAKTEVVVKPMVPDEVFEAALRVIQNKNCEIVKSRNGFYVVNYSEHGPFQTPIGSDWMPVYVARLHQWTSGGIKQDEMETFQSAKETQMPTLS